ncbi:MAG: UbiD family decarboxylase, partial [Dehalococcoidia bacterium]|nr:UbiD family decarboxylase [Dehalococcoidia bacterium]
MRDLRAFIDEVKALGELKVIKGADWDMEIGAITLLSEEEAHTPAILFDEIKGYPAGFRVLVNSYVSLVRSALTLNLPTGLKPMECIKELKGRLVNLKRIPPRTVTDGPILENVHTGKDVNVLKFPAPKWHELDGGRYIGTGSFTITRDPEEGWINLGTYRLMVHDENTLGFYISPGKHGRIHRDKYFARGEPCKVAISLGHDPLFLLAGATLFPSGYSEYDFIGGMMGEPVDVIKGPYTGLPIPANSEIVIEGESVPNETKPEGPFGEWTRYYASKVRPEPVIRVKTILHRNNPIILGEPPGKDISGVPPKVDALTLVRTALAWHQMEAAGIPGIKGIWRYDNFYIVVVSIEQLYHGHARQTLLAASGCRVIAFCGRYIIVVDDDI